MESGITNLVEGALGRITFNSVVKELSPGGFSSDFFKVIVAVKDIQSTSHRHFMFSKQVKLTILRNQKLFMMFNSGGRCMRTGVQLIGEASLI